MAKRPHLHPNTLRRIGRRQFILFLGPLAGFWDGGADPRTITRKLQKAVGAELTGLNLTDAFAAAYSRDGLAGRQALVHELRPLMPTQAGRIHELLAALRPPWVFSCDIGGMIGLAAETVNLEVEVCYLERDTIKDESPERLVLVPILGQLSEPENLILTDSDYDRQQKRLKRALAFVHSRVAGMELLMVGFPPLDEQLHELLRGLAPELQRYGRRVLLIADSLSEAEQNLLERRGCDVLCTSASATRIFIESLPRLISEAERSGPSEEALQLEDLAERLRRKVCDETRDVITMGISQPEHLEMGGPPTLDEIYVPPTLSTWLPAAEEIDRRELDRLARTYETQGKALPQPIRDFLSGRRSTESRKSWKKADAGSQDSFPTMEQLYEALGEIGYSLHTPTTRFDAAAPLQLLEQLSRMVIIGEPASGKSLLLRYLAHSLTRTDQSVTEAMRKLVPLIVPLREYHAQRKVGRALLPYLQKHLANLVGEDPVSVIPLFEQGRVFLLLDGLDEVAADEDRQRISGEIQELLGSVSSNMRCIVTSRPAGYRAARLTQNLPHLRLDLLDDERMRGLLYRWYRRILLKDGKGEAESQNQAGLHRDELFGRLGTQPGLFELCRNPLMLTIAIFIHHIGLELPDRRADFYQRAAELLAQTWIRTKFRDRIELPRQETLMSALESLGFLLHTECLENVLDGERFLRLLTGVFRDHEGYGEERARREAENLKELARNLLGVVVERGLDQFGFVHLTFQEFFAARHLALGDGRHLTLDTLPRYLYDPRWDQVIRMYLQIAPAGDARTVFDHFFSSRHPMDECFAPRPRRLGELLSEPNRVSGEQVARVIGELTCLAHSDKPAPLRADAINRLGGILKGGHERALEAVIESLRDNDPRLRSATVEALGPLAGANAAVRNALLERLGDIDWDVRRGVVEVLRPVAGAEAGVRHALLKRLGDKNWHVRWAVAEALATLAKADASVSDMLLKRLEDKSSAVRWAAAEALGALAGADAGVRNALLKRLGDKNRAVRWTVAEALGTLAGADAQVRNALLERLGDKNRAVRWAVAEALGTLAGADAQVRNALLERLGDKSSAVRGTAAEALGTLAGADAQVRNALLERLGDKSSAVRGAAAEALGTLAATDTQVRDALLERLGDKSSAVRGAAAEALGTLAGTDSQVRDALLERIWDKEWYARLVATQALGSLAGTDVGVRDALLERLGDKEEDVRRAAVQVLGSLAGADGGVREALLERLGDEAGDVRRAAIQAMGSLAGADTRVRDVLLESLGDKDWYVRRAAAEAVAASLDVAVWPRVERRLREIPEKAWESVFSAFDPLVSSWDFAADGLICEDGKWVQQEQLKEIGSGSVERSGASELLQLGQVLDEKRPPSGLSGLKPALDLLLDEYSGVPSREKQKIRNASAQWFAAASAEALSDSSQDRADLLADLALLSSHLKRLCSAIRDEDDRYKHQLFSQIWPAVKNLHGSRMLYERAVARELFETLDRLSLYLPESQKSELETTLAQWRAEQEWPDDHPLRTDPALKRILSTARTRRR